MMPATQTWPAAFANRYRALGYWTDETFTGLLDRRANESGNDIAVSGGSQHWTYADLRNRADVAAAGFRTLDLEAGERVIV
ncbi:MAG: 2,3-dihydroxybenzoate-AMP ligase, partial [Pseudomonadota bacterium]